MQVDGAREDGMKLMRRHAGDRTHFMPDIDRHIAVLFGGDTLHPLRGRRRRTGGMDERERIMVVIEGAGGVRAQALWRPPRIPT